ncbi:MAG: hypothetical protein JWO77_1833 [Ilumatobacteraceae bacterium]|nr:hypothetical protein [Ilumatobacteraceae bacterium]
MPPDAAAPRPDLTSAPRPALGSTGPRVVAVGGGHGLSASLQAVRRYASTITAIVSVADDGGSTGALRAMLPDLPAPGDVRKSLGALAEADSPIGRVLEHRFSGGDLEGHALGNLLLVALSQDLGSFSAAVDELAKRVGAVGRVLPATIGPVDLHGWRLRSDGPDGPEGAVAEVDGQVAVQNASGVFEVRLEPASPPSDPAVRAAILGADQVVIGPGSLFTSVLAAAIVPAVHEALLATAARRIFVANLGPQVPETAGFTVESEVAALHRHGVDVDAIIVDPSRDLGDLGAVAEGATVTVRPVAAGDGRVHDPELLAAALEDLGS